MENPGPRAVRARLLRWFDAHRRDFPWRGTGDPYRTLLAEYLLQRTRVATGTPYYERFLERFPDIRALAAASLDDVLQVWEGLGFYGRARNLHATARAIVDERGGRIPTSAKALEALPGIGPYTAGAVASMAFGQRVPVIDGNATRALARLYTIREDVSQGPGRARVDVIARRLVPASRPGAFNQALMELGATVCVPRVPRCESCPLLDVCRGRRAGIQGLLPTHGPRRPSPTVRVAFALMSADDRVLLVRRPAAGLLAGLWALPGGELPDAGDHATELPKLVRAQTGIPVDVRGPVRDVAHTFSHRKWSGAIYRCVPTSSDVPSNGARWVRRSELTRLPVVAFHRAALASAASGPPIESFDAGRRSP